MNTNPPVQKGKFFGQAIVRMHNEMGNDWSSKPKLTNSIELITTKT